MKISLRTKLVALIFCLIFGAVGLLSYQSLNFFSRDKETYVYDLISQVINVQSAEVEEKLRSLKGLLELFDDFSGYSLAIDERQRFLKKYSDFYYLGTFNRTSTGLQDRLVIADRSMLESIGYTAESIKAEKKINTLLKSKQTFAAINITVKAEAPLVALVVRTQPDRVVLGVVPQRTLLSLDSSRTVYTPYLVDAAGDLLLHPNGALLTQQRNLKQHPMVQAWLQNPELSMTTEFLRSDTTGGKQGYLGAYAGLQQSGLGMFIEVPKDQAFLAAKRLIKSSSILAGLIFLSSCFVGILFAYTITRPLQKLGDFTKKVAKGDFSGKLDVQSGDEIGELVNSFNLMNVELDERDKKLEEANSQLVQSEKMGAFGQMSAGIAHEVKNPLAGILGYAQLAKRKLEEDSPVRKNLDIIEKETRRCKDIIENLMKFARQEASEFTATDVNQAVRDAIALVDHQISISDVKIVQEISENGDLPTITGNANQLQQVFMNLMLNAQHAMEEGGTLTVSTQKGEDGQAVVKIADTGAGIAPEHLNKIFEPFFTTKEAGKGTGLGLAVSYGIIKDHKGEIEVASELGQGTTFTISLPAITNGASEQTAQATQAVAGGS